jgi:EAL domain-containing protein (putative c-di-GMP-specific phosphodiesterase class I)
LKIDRSFIKDVCHDPKNAAITNTIITLAHNLNLHVIAEGVESIEQIEFLSLNECFRIQGYFYSRPIKPYDLVETYF